MARCRRTGSVNPKWIWSSGVSGALSAKVTGLRGMRSLYRGWSILVLRRSARNGPAAQRPPRGRACPQRAGARKAAVGAGRTGGYHRADRHGGGTGPVPPGQANARRRDPAGQPARPRPARPIRKGRIDCPVEFGYKAHVLDNDDGIVVDYSVECGAATDGPQLAPAVEHVRCRAGRVPAVTADRGLGQAAVEQTCARCGRAYGSDSPAGHHLPGPRGRRARPQLPPARQMAHRL